MNRILLTLMALLPLVVGAQERDPSATNNPPGGDDPTQAAASIPNSDGFLARLGTATATGAGGYAYAFQQPNAQPRQPTPAPAAAPTPRIPGSMVGYIDNPIVESQIRIRFDAAFENEFPDRAEFFYAKCGCYRLLQDAIPPAFDPNAPGPGPGVPRAINFQELYLNAEYSPHRRFSAFVEVPIRWLQPQGFQSIPPFPAFSNQTGLGDVIVGFKFAAVATETTYLTFQLKSFFPSGDASKGLGTNHYSVEPSLLLYRNLSSRFTLEGQLGDRHPVGGSAGVPITGSQGFAGDVFFYGIGPSYKAYSGQRITLAPVVELFGWHGLSGFQTEPVTGALYGAATDWSGMNVVNLKVGVRVGIGSHNSFYTGFGQALTHDNWYKHIVRLEYRFTL
jgi:Putative MetA-pathway of phenol degradation